MHKQPIIALFLLFFPITLLAQQNNIWYFGRNAGLDFNSVSGQPTPRALNNSSMQANEGTSSICDALGNILFYSNGVTVFNRLHQVMVNGDNLMGNNSSVQSSVIIPVPGNDSIYYLFTTDAIENNFVNGYRYSIINMRLDNGNGAVISKNVLLFDGCTERMVAARHANGTDTWLITNDFNSDTFRAWIVNCDGLQTTPVVSNSGVMMNSHLLMNTGMMKVSPDGTQLCQTHFPNFDITFVPNFVQIFDFNNASGIVSGAKSVSLTNTQFISCEFSPDSKLLYLTAPGSRAIQQVEAKLPTAAAIAISATKIPTPNAVYYGIQLAPDGKIYLAQPSSYLGAINQPNVKGLGCNFIEKQISLGQASSILGLPAFINDFSSNPNNGFTYAVTDSCSGTVQFTGITTMAGVASYQWDFGDGNTSTLPSPQHSYLVPGQTYTVKVKITSSLSCGVIERAIKIFPGGIVAEPLFDYVDKCDSGYVRFTNLSNIYPNPADVQILWDFDDGTTSSEQNPVHSFPQAGSYEVKLSVLTSKPCLDRSITQTITVDVLDIQVSPGVTVDPGVPVQLQVTGGGTTFTWTPSRGLSDPTSANPIATTDRNTLYKVTATNDAGCRDVDSVLIKINPYPGIFVPTAFTPNNDGKNDLLKPSISNEYELQEFSIYNRWGMKIFSTRQTGVGWDGRLNNILQDSGVFIWTLNAVDTRTGEKKQLKGNFVIIR